MEPDADVLIIGAGPTGLTLAICLRQFGLRVRLIDRAAAPSHVSKALAVWSASLEALQGLGASEALLAAGKRLKSLCIGDGPHRLARLEIGAGIDSPFPFPLLLPQSQTERILAARLSELGGTVERGVELIGLTQDTGGVTARLRHADGREEEARAAYLAGCDGARSAVRHSLGIAFDGYTEPATYLLGDVRIDGGDLDRDSIHIWWGDGGSVALFPFEADSWRVFAMRPQPEADGATAPAEDAPDATPSLGELQDHVSRYGPPGLTLRDPSWLSAFRINERVAASYRAGRCFLAGDAAHIHSPAGGQGMNTGMQDAANLGWKLAHALKDVGDAELLLSSYEPERRPVALSVVKAAGQKLHIAFAKGRAARLIKNAAVTLIGNLPAAQRQLQIELSETEIAYQDGDLLALGEPPRHNRRRTDAGTRARDGVFLREGQPQALWPLLGGTRHVLLVLDDESAPVDLLGRLERTSDHLTVLRVAPEADPDSALRARYAIDTTGWALIRPDFVIAARGGPDDLKRLDRYLDEVVRG
ncbi:FAD-dependent monooxygenase [Ancylobacter radicis]|uniref:FAD-dependent monooxygenase n=1 Tax=Ancylobacter radicis TaxID=2836179 RepID=A0ABS5RBA2_9HYPH|nr:FAD-dependent monooxygenase [Ancylobacter radicis]MBS9478945.1 FAD-dependent monooxygenase [Ancylobacter radicis]